MNNGLLLDSLKMSNITNLTDKRVKNIKVGELESLLKDIPEDYKMAIVSCLKTIFTEKDEEIVKDKRLDLAQMIEQVIFINMQKVVIERLKEAE